jgi:hypothetical protein
MALVVILQEFDEYIILTSNCELLRRIY